MTEEEEEEQEKEGRLASYGESREAASTSSTSSQDSQDSTVRALPEVEYADTDHICSYCLPVRGDEIVGTRPVKCSPGEAALGYRLTTTHRMGCKHAMKATTLKAGKPLVGGRAGATTEADKAVPQCKLETVNLAWKPLELESQRLGMRKFLTQLEVHLNDSQAVRKCTAAISNAAMVVGEDFTNFGAGGKEDKGDDSLSSRVGAGGSIVLKLLVMVQDTEQIEQCVHNAADVDGVIKCVRCNGRTVM